jgi:four helix bundle protein
VAIRTYKDLNVYRESFAAAMVVFKVSKTFPRFEQVELARQLRRSARSVPASIVEGRGKRFSEAEFKRYLQNALGSCQETSMWLDMSLEEGYLTKEKHAELSRRYGHIGAMIVSLWRKWRTFKTTSEGKVVPENFEPQTSNV